MNENENEEEDSEAGGDKSRKEDPRIGNMIAHLVHLAQTADKISESRAALAELRQALNNPLRGAKHVVPSLGTGRATEDEKWFFLIASLFAYHRRHEPGNSLGDAFRRIKDDSGSIESRFLGLLAAPSAQLPDRLRSVVTLLNARDVPLDWQRLLNDVLYWDSPGKRRQHALARDFYRNYDNAATSADAIPQPNADH